ncbi:MAG: GGDEF domain-containing protein [Clostridiales bacterium]|jgi:diguanylate cyclase (GGDEF)-like protein|nr:GGDEF domain-containing protein [Clostridiales bacterium]
MTDGTAGTNAGSADERPLRRAGLVSAIQRYLIKRAEEQPDPAAYYHFLSMSMLSAMAVVPHIVYVVYFWIEGAPPLTVSHGISVLVYVFTYALLRRGYYKTASVVLSMEVVVSSLVMIYYVGTEAQSQFFMLLVAIAHMTVLKFVNKDRMLVMLILFACFFGSFFIGSFAEPVYASTVDDGLKYFNVDFIFLATVVILSTEKFVGNMTELSQENKLTELEKQANIDPLTGLYNRRFATEFFNKIRRGGPIANIELAMIDIDDFKLINDTYGHANGDKALVALSATLKSSLRQSDYVFRWGGEEFLIAMVNTDSESAFRVADTIRQRIEKNVINLDGREASFTITVGLSRLEPRQIDQSIIRCDKNLYKGKRAGKNQVVAE